MDRSHSAASRGFRSSIPSRRWASAATAKQKTGSDFSPPGSPSESDMYDISWCAELPVPEEIDAKSPGSAAAPSINGFTSGRSSRTYAASGSDSAHGEAVQMELLRIQNLMLRVAARHPELQVIEDESTEESVSRLAMHYRRLLDSSTTDGSMGKVQQHEAQIRQLRNDLVYEQKRHQELHKRDEEQKARLEAKVNETQRQLAERVAVYTEENKVLRVQVQTLQQKHSDTSADVKKVPEKIPGPRTHYDRDIEALNQEIIEMRDMYERRLRKATEEHQTHLETTASKLHQQSEKYGEEMKAMGKETQELIEHQKKYQSREVEALHRKIAHLVNNQKEVEQMYQNELRKAADGHKSESQRLQSSLEETSKSDKERLTKKIEELEHRLMAEGKGWNVHIKQREKEAKAQVENIQKQTAESLNRVKEEHACATKKRDIAFVEERQALQKKNDQQVKALVSEIQKLSTQYKIQQEELRDTQKSHDKRKIEEEQRLQVVVAQHEQALLKQFEQEKQGLRLIIEDFKQSATKATEPKGLSDSEIIARFGRLANAIEDFSRLQWDSAKEAGWWQEQFEQLQAKNRRRIKQQIVQNSVWMTLYKNLFQSPFKFFDGQQVWKEHNKIWLEVYAAGDSSSTWPKIAQHLEDMRCDNAKQLRAMIPSQPEDGNKTVTEFQSLYEQLISQTVDGIAAPIIKVALVKDRDLKLLENIVRTATALWLECCSQRYRLTVSLVTGIEDILGLSQGHIRMVKLMLKPGLRRFGNMRGQNLSEEEVIHGWRSHFEVYPPQRNVSG